MFNFKERIYKFEKQSNFTATDSHPLMKIVVKCNPTKVVNKSNNSNEPISKSTPIFDPLSTYSPSELINDPLSGSHKVDSVYVPPVVNMEPWSSKRITILSTYTTTEKLSIISSFLIRKPEEEIRVLNKSNSLLDKVKNRLEQLDQFDEEVRETSNLSVQQFTDKINELQNALKISWRDGQRVKSLQIIIQSTKLLSETTAVQFFPSKFVLITDLVDNFASYVFDRLKSKSAHIQRGSKYPIELPNDFKESQVPEIAKETARNWFYKIASIRELVARLYIEACLLPCYRFFDSKVIPDSLIRLMKMARGIGNPLLATYARAYVARIGIVLEPTRKDYLQLAFNDILDSLKRFINSKEELDKIKTESNDKTMPFLKLFVPAVDWILQCLCNGATDKEIDLIIQQIESAQNPLLVHSALNSISTNYIEKKPQYFAELIHQLPETTYPKYAMYKQLGACVSLSFSLGHESAMLLLKFVWKYITKLTEPRYFVECADSWAEFLAKNFDNVHINRYMAHIVKEMTRDNLYLEFSNQLLSILNKLLNSKCDFENLLSSPEFVLYIAMFDREPYIIEVRQMILDSFFNSKMSESLSDPVVIQSCIRLLKEMYDSLNSLSVSDSKRTVTRLILALVDRIKFEGKNVEDDLNLLTQFRSTFGGIEVVIFNIVERVNSLAMRVRSLRPNKEHNSASASFVRACMAFSYITIPSIEDLSLVIKLYTSTAQVALVNGCLGQAEACIKESVHLLSKLENDRSISAAVVAEMAASLASTLLMCPDINAVIVDNPGESQQILYLLKGLINAINQCPILKTDHVPTDKSVIKGELFIKVLLLLAAFSQSHYVYYAGKTDANDKIYGGSDHFLSVISDIFIKTASKIRALNSPIVNKRLKEALMIVLRCENLTENSLNQEWFAQNNID